MAAISMEKQTTIKVVLREEDIPGARLPRENAEECTVTQLKRWLLCRGAKTSGKKAELIKRFKDYVQGGLHLKNLRDPDGGIHLARKKASLGVMEEMNPAENVKDSFPKDGFSEDLADLPTVNFGTVWRYMIETIDAKRQLSTAKPLVKGYNFYKSGNVLTIKACFQQNKWFIKSQVLPSMKKNCVYNCHTVLLSNGTVKLSYCVCPAGVDGRCNHIAATLFALDEHCRQRQKQQQTTEQISCTSAACKWNVPRKRKGDVVPISEMKFQKHEYGKEKSYREPEVKPDKDVRAPHQRKFDNTKRYNVLYSVQKVQAKTGQTIGLSHILPVVTPKNLAEIIRQEHDYCKLDKNEQTEVIQDSSPSPEMPIINNPPSLQELRLKCHDIRKQLFVSEEEARDIERKTRSQSATPLWHKFRQQRITSSKTYRCAVLKQTTSPTKAVQEVLGYKTFESTPAMKEGLAREPDILKDFIVYMKEKGHKGITVEKAGLVVSSKHCFLAASPDGLVNDPTNNPPEGMIEMKYVQMKQGESLKDSLIRKRVCMYDKGEIVVNHNHQYYYQMQHQMFVCGRLWNDFVVKGSLSSELFVQRVEFNHSFWSRIFPKLELFFEQHVLPEMAFPRIKYGLSRPSM